MVPLVTSHPAVDAVLAGMGAATLSAGFLGLVWRIARPHVRTWVDAQLAPIREDLETVRHEVKPNGGASLKDRAVQAHDAASSADEKLDHINATLHRIGRQVTQVDGRQRVTQSVLDQHVSESSRYLASVREILAESGIRLPSTTEAETEDPYPEREDLT